MPTDIAQQFWRAPPVSRTIVASMFALSVLVHGRLMSAERVIFHTSFIFRLPPQLWRLLSSFLLTGGGFSFFFDLYFTWTYGTGLELNSPRFTVPGDFFIYVCFICTVILVCFRASFCITITKHLSFLPVQPLLAVTVPGLEEDYPCGTCRSVIRKAIKDCVRYRHGGGSFEKAIHDTTIYVLAGIVLKAVIFTGPMILAFVYTFAQDNQGKKAHFILFQIPIELLPWAMLLLTLLLGGPGAAMVEGTGIVAAHLYDFLTRLYPTFQGGTNYVQTPAAVRRYFGSEQTQRTSKAYGQAIRPGQPNQPGQSRGWTTGFSNNWVGRGSGRRLGGD